VQLGEHDDIYEDTCAERRRFFCRAIEWFQALVSAVVFDSTELPVSPELFSLTGLLVLFSSVRLLLPFALGVLPFRLSVT